MKVKDLIELLEKCDPEKTICAKGASAPGLSDVSGIAEFPLSYKDDYLIEIKTHS